MAGRKRFIFRDEQGNQFSATSITRALNAMPAKARGENKKARGENKKARGENKKARGDPPESVEDLWTGDGESLEPNLERVYHA